MELFHVAPKSGFNPSDVGRSESQECDSRMSLIVTSYRHMKDILSKINDSKLVELNLVIEELAADDAECLASLSRMCKLCNLRSHNLQKFSLTYEADNTCGNNNAARFVIVMGLLNQLNWDTCERVNVNLYFNYLDNDPRLDLLQELPLVLTVNGKESVSSHSDARSLRLIQQTYPYLEGYL